MCGCECFISAKSIHSSFISWRDRYWNKLKDKIQNSQSRRSVEKAHRIYETYNSTVMPHGRHIYAKASDMSKAEMCTFPQYYHAIPHWKCVLRCYKKCPCINISDREIDNQYSETIPSIRFHIYHIIGIFTANGRIPLKDKKICYICKQESSSDKYKNIYTRKELVMMETTISDFHASFYIPANTI